MFLLDRRNKMVRKIAILISMFLLCLGLDNCKSPVAPEEPEPIYEYEYEYRYNIRVVFTHATEQISQDFQMLYCYLYDPALWVSPDWQKYDQVYIKMDTIGKNEYRCYLPKVFIQTPAHPTRHYVVIWFDKNKDTIMPTIDNIDVQGAYDQEVEITDWTSFYKFRLYFKMS